MVGGAQLKYEEEISVSGQPVTVSGNIVQISGQQVEISGQPVTVSGNFVSVNSGIGVIIQSGAGVTIASGVGSVSSGDTLRLSGQFVLISGQGVNVLSGTGVIVQSGIIVVPTKAVEAITDWTEASRNEIIESGTLDCSGHAATLLHIQAALETTTAHTGTRFMVQVSSNTSGDEDWQDYTEFIGLIGTAVEDDIENNPLAAGATSITLTAHTYTVLAKWLFIEDVFLTNSELVFVVSQTANAVVILDGVTNEHQNTAKIYNVALSQVVLIDPSVNRVRVLVDNSYDNDGSAIYFKIRASKATSL